LPNCGKCGAQDSAAVKEKLTKQENILARTTRVAIEGIVTGIPLDSVTRNEELWSIRV
jgi:hypothetical protein